MRTKDMLAGALLIAAFLTSGDELWQIGLTAGLIAAALAVQGAKQRRRR